MSKEGKTSRPTEKNTDVEQKKIGLIGRKRRKLFYREKEGDADGAESSDLSVQGRCPVTCAGTHFEVVVFGEGCLEINVREPSSQPTPLMHCWGDWGSLALLNY